MDAIALMNKIPVTEGVVLSYSMVACTGAMA